MEDLPAEGGEGEEKTDQSKGGGRASCGSGPVNPAAAQAVVVAIPNGPELALAAIQQGTGLAWGVEVGLAIQSLVSGIRKVAISTQQTSA
eukprot:14173696-Alexandrium_andersonii.AAC.1